MPPIIRARPKTPPTTPPAMAPTFVPPLLSSICTAPEVALTGGAVAEGVLGVDVTTWLFVSGDDRLVVAVVVGVVERIEDGVVVVRVVEVTVLVVVRVDVVLLG